MKFILLQTTDAKFCFPRRLIPSPFPFPFPFRLPSLSLSLSHSLAFTFCPKKYALEIIKAETGKMKGGGSETANRTGKPKMDTWPQVFSHTHTYTHTKDSANT